MARIAVEVLRRYPRGGRIHEPGVVLLIPEYAVDSATRGPRPYARTLDEEVEPLREPTIADLLLGEAMALVTATDDVELLRAYHEQEAASPRYKGGRVKLRNKIEERIGELSVALPELPGRLAEELAAESGN